MSADAKLIALGKRFCAAWDAEQAVFARNAPVVECDAAMDVRDAIIDEIANARATTVHGLKIKAAALVPFEDEPDGEMPRDERLLASLLADLRAM